MKVFFVFAVFITFVYSNSLDLECQDTSGNITAILPDVITSTATTNGIIGVVNATLKKERDSTFSLKEYLDVWVVALLPSKKYNNAGVAKMLYRFDMKKNKYICISVLIYTCEWEGVDSQSLSDIEIMYDINQNSRWEFIPPGSTAEWIFNVGKKVVGK